ncbi:MAG: hypothetical protein IKP09_10600 [Lentisphaeria bacterium]|nr:hypothetical protein [Lentisphaeria bacterium]
MTGGGEVNARWHSRENKQSNYNLVEDLDLRIGDVLGLGSAYPAVIEFFGEGSGGYKQYISSGGTSGYVDYTWDAIDPGEIHSVTASKGLVVQANWNKQDFTYIGSGAVTFNGLGTVVLKDNHSRYSSDSYYGTGPYLGSAYDEYYFGVVKGVYNEEDGTLENYTVLDGDVSSGGFDWEGFLMVGSGGIVQNIGSASPLKTGNDIVNSDTWTPEYTRDKCKVLTVVAGGLADNVTVKGAVSNYEHNESQYTESRAGLLVSSGGTATNVTVLEGGIAMAKGGTIDKVFVAAGGVLYLSGWAGAHQVGERDSDYNLQLSGPQYMDTTVLNGVRLDSGGQLTNTLDWGFRKGNAPSVIANKGGGIMNGVTANGVAYVSGLDYAGGITLTKDQQAIDVTVRGYNKITSRDEEGNPTAYTTVIASLNVSSGGIVKGATVGEEGAIYASNGADMSGLVASGGRIIFANSSGWSDYFAGSATVKGITVRDGGALEVNSKFGLTATDVKIEQDAGLEFTLGKTASEDYTPTALNGTWTADWGNGTFQTNDGVLTGFGGQFGHEYRDLFYSSAYVSARLSMTIIEGGVLAGGDLRGYGSVLVKNGGRMLDTKLQGVGASIAASGYASGLSATIASGKNAYGTNIYVYGEGAVAEATVLNGGYMGVERGGVVNSVTMLCPEGYEGPAGNDTEVGPVEFEVMAGGTANNVIASAGVITLLDGSKEPGTAGPTLSNADVHSAAMLIVKGDGAVLDGTLNLAGTVFTTGKRYEYVEVEVEEEDPNNPGQTIKYTDYQRVELNNSVADAATLTVNFDLTELEAPGETAMIDNLANLTGVTLDRISVTSDQTPGSYVLAGGSEGYNGSLKVIRDGSFAGTITVGGFLQVTEDVTYKLSNTTDAGLVFSVLSTDAAITDIIATADGKELLKGKWSKYAVNIKTEVNQYSKSIWYRIKQAVKPRKGPGDADDEGWIELDNEQGLTISEYCIVALKAKNEKGKDSKIVSYTVNYDATAPEFSGLGLVSGEPFLTPGVESAVSVFVTDDLDDAPAVQLSLNDGVWTDVVRSDDGSYVFNLTGGIDGFQLRAVDHAENETVLTVSRPADPVAAADIITVTNQDVTVTAEFSANSTLKQYSLDGGETWLAYEDGVVFTENGTVSFRAANILGYSGVATLTVDYIDRIAPEKPVAVANITELTNQDVTVTATFSEDSVVKEYTLDGGATWQAYDAGGVIIIINGTVGFRGTDAAGNVSEVASYEVTNIDKEPPAAPAASADTTEKVNNGTVTVTATFSEDSVVKEYSLDGTTWQVYTGPVVFEENGSVFFRATDAAGNLSDAAGYEVTNIVHVEEDNGPDNGNNNSLIENGKLKEPDSVNEPEKATGEIFVDSQYSVEVERDGVIYHNCVGSADKTDFAQLKLDKAAKLSFTVNATDKVKMTLYRIVEGKKGATMKAVTNLSLSKAGEAGMKKPVFVEAGEYYIGVESKNGKAAETFYNVSMNDDSEFYSDGDDGTNNYVYDAKKEPKMNPRLDELAENIVVDGTEEILLDSMAVNSEEWSNFVGLGDAADYAVLTLEHAASLSFQATATDSAKFTVWRFDEGTGKKASAMKSLQGTTLKKAKNAETYSAETKDLLLQAGTYYISMESKNAAKGGSAYYNVELNGARVFADGDDGRNDYVYDKKAAAPMNPNLGDLVSTDIDTETTFISLDDAIESEEWDNFVGFGDAADYAKITLSSDAKLSFALTATDAAKFTVYKLVEKADKKGNISYSMKSLQSTALKKKKTKDAELFTATTKALSMDAGEYYICMQSTNAAKGGAAYYNVELNRDLCSGLPAAAPASAASGADTSLSAAGASLDPASDSLFGKSGVGLLASL